MGVNANFQADFTTFHAAVDLAIVKLADFGKGAADVGDRLESMVDKWSGRKLIQDADLLVVAINKVGGATALTTTEQTKLNAILNEAIAKYKVIGEEVPPEVQRLADATKQVATETKTAQAATTDWRGVLENLAGAFGIAFSVGAVVNFGKELFADAQALDTLSKQIRTSVQDLVILRGATESYGVSAEEIGRALFTLRDRIAGGDTSVSSAYAKMGISMDTVRAKQNDAIGLLELTQKGLASVGSEIQDTSSKDLYGGKLGASMIGLAKGFDDLVAKSREANKGVGESTKVMAEYADAIDRAERALKNIATVVVGAPLRGFDALSGAVKENVSWWTLAAAAFEDWRRNAGGEIFAGVANGLAAVSKGQQDIVLTSDKVTAAMTKEAEAAAFMAAIEANAAPPLEAWQIKHLEHLKEIGQLTATNAAGVKVTAEQFEKYKAEIEATTKATAEHKKAIEEQDKIAMDVYTKQIKTLEDVTKASLAAYSLDEQIEQLEALKIREEDLARAVYAQLDSEKLRMKVLDDLTAKEAAIDVQEDALKQKKLKRINEAMTAEDTAQARVMAAYGQNVDGTVKVENAQTKLQKALDALHNSKQEGVSQYYEEQELMDQFLKDQAAEVEALDKSTAAHDRETAAIKRKGDARDTFSLAGASNVPDKFAGWSQERMRLAGYIDLYGKVTPAGEAAGLGDSGGPIRPTGQRASGGPVESGGAYLVGERGPELFVPSQNGAIVPNGGGATITNVFHIVDTESNIARRVADQITRSVMRSTRLS